MNGVNEDEFVEGLYPSLLQGVMYRDVQIGDVWVLRDGSGVRVVAIADGQEEFEGVTKEYVDDLRDRIAKRRT